jgi:uncharacterized protein YjiS (DUF1127 family)
MRRPRAARCEGDIVSKLTTFRSDGALWPLAQGIEQARAPQAGSFLSKLRSAPWRAAKALLSEIVARRAMQKLDSLDDRMLRDIGIDRGQIGRAARYGRSGLKTMQLPHLP